MFLEDEEAEQPCLSAVFTDNASGIEAVVVARLFQRMKEIGHGWVLFVFVFCFPHKYIQLLLSGIFLSVLSHMLWVTLYHERIILKGLLRPGHLCQARCL